MNKNFIDLTDYDKETLLKIIERAVELKNGAAPISGRDKVLAMIFNKPSTRTNVSFQMAMHRLGGRAIYLGSETMQLSRGESISDTARTLSRYVDAIMIRTYAHSDVEELAEVASVPVINGLTDLLHPCQALADVMSFMEKKGDNFSELKMTYVGDGNNVCNSLINAAGIFGFSFTLSVPKGYEPDKDILSRMQSRNPRIKIVREPNEAVQGADAVYTDVWVSMGDDLEEAAEKKTIFAPYQINEELMSQASSTAIVLHCLPAHRGEEITGQVIDGPQSYVFEQAENRMYIQEAILEYLFN